MTIVIGTTLTTFAMLDPNREFLWNAWLKHKKQIQETHDVKYFAAIEVDSRGIDPFEPLLPFLDDYWIFSLDDGRKSITTSNRGRHITNGQNLISEYASASGASHILHMAADTAPPFDVIPKLLEVNNPIVAAQCDTYCMDSPLLSGYGFPVTGPPMTVVCVLIDRSVFTRLRWRWDRDLGLTDDPAYTLDAKELLGVDSLTRKDCIATHYPLSIGPIETRFPGLDMSVNN